ncbi:MAG TPA: fatty acid desaturase [Candidatus Binatia bacterium]|nr:fatty acid desaturase [Candidatus Binatia bacterium]
MTTTAATAPPAPARVLLPERARIWAWHLLCFVLPLATLAFLLTAPHSAGLALPWLLVLVGSVVADVSSAPERRQPVQTLPGWPFDSVLYALVALQVANVALGVRMIAQQGFWRADTLVAWLLVGVNSGYSGIVVAHELIHRAERHRQLLGRLLLCTVLYEHFFTEHLRGHHARVGTPDDPATARFGETNVAFLRRTVPAQLRSAWRLEAKRLGDERMRWWDSRLLRSRVVHGLAVEWSAALAILVVLGPGAFAFYLLQAGLAVRLLETVNYLEHWGLTRAGRRVGLVDSWDTDSRFTLYTLVGLSRHADHHAHAARPYQQLRFVAESPKLPFGYFGTVVLAIFRNDRFRALMTAELRRRRLGPFAG